MMSEAIKIDQVNALALSRACMEIERMSDADLDALCVLVEAEITARRNHDTRKRTAQNHFPVREP